MDNLSPKDILEIQTAQEQADLLVEVIKETRKTRDAIEALKIPNEINAKEGITFALKGVEMIKGEKGDSYILTREDKKEIASFVDVPIVERIIEKTETIREIPTVSEKIVEVAIKDTPKEIKEKLLKEGISYSEIKDLPEVKLFDLKGKDIVEKINALSPNNPDYKIDAIHIKNLPRTNSSITATSAIRDLTDVSIENLTNNQILKYNSTSNKWENSTGGGGGGTVDSVVAGTGISVDNTDPANPIVSATGSAPAWGDITGTLSDQTDLQTALDGKVDENAVITGATKTKITYDAKGLVTAGADATTADIADSLNKRYVTDAQLTVIGNTSGTNTGDVTVTDSSEIDLTLTGQNITASLIAGSIDETKLDASVNASLDLADTSVQPARAINTTAPLAGGGDLSADRTLTTSMSTNKLIGRATAGTGVMEEITLGTGLSFTGTTLNASGGGASPLTTKGDLYTFSTVDDRLPVGTDGQILVADSAQATGLKWDTAGTSLWSQASAGTSLQSEGAYPSTASGTYSFAGGYCNTASALDTTAVGFCNTASGDYSSAVGTCNTASCTRSNALGSYNCATAENSSAVGFSSCAGGYQSSVFGNQSYTLGDCAVAIGFLNTGSVYADCSVLVGIGNTSSSYCSNLFGSSNSDNSFPRGNAFGTSNNVCGQYTTAVGWNNIAGGGYCSSAVGASNTASGYYSLAAGACNFATFTSATAVGAFNSVTGDRSTGVGVSNTVSTYCASAFGAYNTANANCTLAVGYMNNATVGFGSAVGAGNCAAGDNSTAFGYSNTASNSQSSALGYYNTASGVASSASGYNNTASGDSSLSVGRSNLASGGYSSAAGVYNNAAAGCSIAVGFCNTASVYGGRSSAVGHCNNTSACSASAIGSLNTSSGLYSSAIGFCNAASGDYSSASGYKNLASGNCSSAFGYVNCASGVWASAVGAGNIASCNQTTAVGYSNTASLYDATAVGFCNTASGCGANAFGRDNTAIGQNSNVFGLSNTDCCGFSTTLGNGNLSCGTGNMILSTQGTATGCDNTIHGQSNSATGDRNTVIGYASTASGYETNAIGSGAQTAIDNTTVITGPFISKLSSGSWTAAFRWAELGSGMWIARTEMIDLKTTQTIQISLPVASASGKLPRVQINEVGVVINDPSSDNPATTGATASFGISGNNTKYLAATLMATAVAPFKRDRFTTLLADDGEQTLTFEVTTGATATVLNGYAYWVVMVYPEEP